MRYIITTMDTFFEVFDTKEKITMFASECKQIAVEERDRLNREENQ